ncbi:YraN family protein [Zhongshania sp.]|jgi:putative endonuclease|uniref:YraN family protein n=1 Tax=Zhongshania sp. TaxID=1971902 RepID=UPI002A826C2F|nr:YraN family protein [Zhongshania sp.]
MWPKLRPTNTGKRAEQAACRYLQKHKLKIIAKNYSCRFGEIDIVCLSDQHLVFVEVRYRRTAHYGSAAETVNFAKQQRIILTARHYLSCNAGAKQYSELPCRFDVIEASPGNSGELQLNWLPNAFQE